VVATLSWILLDGARLFQQVCSYNSGEGNCYNLLRSTVCNCVSLTVLNVATSHFSGLIEMDSDEFTKSAGVVISHSFGVTKGF